MLPPAAKGSCSVWTTHTRNHHYLANQPRSLLLGNTESLSSSAGRLGTLSADLDAPVVAETSVEAHLLHPFKILTESGVTDIGDELGERSILDATLSVKEPLGDAVVQRLGEDV